MPVTHVAQTTQDQREIPAGVARTHPRYAFDTTWQHNISRCERGLQAVLGAPCRCGGALFGKQRGKDFAFFAQLPTTDPHSFQVPARHPR